MEFLEAGKIVKTHGLKGRVKVLSYLESGELLRSLDEVYISQQSGRNVKFRLRDFQVKGNCFYLEMDGVESIEQAEALLGLPVLVSTDQLEPLAEGQYYWQQLMGLEVITEDGMFIGRIAEIFPTGSNDVFVCRGGNKEVLLPAIEDVVLNIDLERRMMRVRMLEGL